VDLGLLVGCGGEGEGEVRLEVGLEGEASGWRLEARGARLEAGLLIGGGLGGLLDHGEVAWGA